MKRIGYIDGRRIAGFNLAGAAALNGMALTIRDLLTFTTEYGHGRGIYLNFTQVGAKGVLSYSDALAIEYILAGDVTYANAINISMNFSGTPTCGYYAGLQIYGENPGAGNALNYYVALMLGLDVENAPLIGSHFMRVFGHGGAVTSVIWLANTSGSFITNLLKFEGVAAPLSPGSDTTDCTYRIACEVGPGPAIKYLHLFDS